MRTRLATEPGTKEVASEDRALVGPHLVVVLDGLTERTESGCIHGTPWFVDNLSGAIAEHAGEEPARALRLAIRQVAASHRDTCDLSSPGSPAAATGIVKVTDSIFSYLVLGDVSLVIDTGSNITVITDARI